MDFFIKLVVTIILEMGFLFQKNLVVNICRTISILHIQQTIIHTSSCHLFQPHNYSKPIHVLLLLNHLHFLQNFSINSTYFRSILKAYQDNNRNIWHLGIEFDLGLWLFMSFMANQIKAGCCSNLRYWKGNQYW